MKKSDKIKKEMVTNMKRLDDISHALNVLECGDKDIERAAVTHIIITMFELMDSLAAVEPELYEYIRKRGWVNND